MGDESGRDPIMTRIWWWLIGIMARTLEPGEREVVYGDLAESGESGRQAFCDVLGLVVRRQAALWVSWRSWLALVMLVVPLGMLLCLVSRRTADGSAIYIWLYANNWDWAFLGNAGFRSALAHNSEAIAIQYVTLAGCSWTAGFLLGFVSRRCIPGTGILFMLLLFFGEYLGTPPRHLGHALFYRARDFHPNAAVFDLTFYRLVFPLIVQAGLVLTPSIWGMRRGLRASLLSKENT